LDLAFLILEGLLALIALISELCFVKLRCRI
jgi:hypothetical protein